jgi:hypothetical protein
MREVFQVAKIIDENVNIKSNMKLTNNIDSWLNRAKNNLDIASGPTMKNPKPWEPEVN